MAVAAPRLLYSFADYVRFERDAHEKHEFVGGLILAMAGGTLEHARLASALIAELVSQLRGERCSVFDSNARVRVRASGNAYYPDASVVGGQLETDPDDAHSLMNPSVLVEVLSPSTAEYDRTDKLADYQSIDSLRAIVHLAHDERRIDVWSRTGDSSWELASFRAGQVAALAFRKLALDVTSVYRDPLEG